MKTTIKFFAALMVMMGFAMSTKAVDPQSANANIVGKASVAAQVTVAKVTDLNFMNVAPGVVKTINFSSAVTAGTANGGETKGQFVITKSANTQVTLDFTTLPTSLAGKTGTDTETKTLPISYTAQLFKTATAVHPIAAPEEGNTVPVVNASTTAPYYATDAFQLDLGGTVTPATNQTAGDYESTITLTATYN